MSLVIRNSLLGDTWNFEDAGSDTSYDVSARFLTLESFCEWSDSERHVNPNAIVVLVTSLDVEKISAMTSELRVPVFVVYKYASESDLKSAREARIFTEKLSDTNWHAVVESISAQVVTEDDSYTEYQLYDDEQLEHFRRCETNERVEPENLVEIIYLQRAIIDHLSRTTDSAFDLALVEAVRTSENAIERALQMLADKHGLLA